MAATLGCKQGGLHVRKGTPREARTSMADAKPMRTARPVTLNTLVASTTAAHQKAARRRRQSV